MDDRLLHEHAAADPTKLVGVVVPKQDGVGVPAVEDTDNPYRVVCEVAARSTLTVCRNLETAGKEEATANGDLEATERHDQLLFKLSNLVFCVLQNGESG